MKTRNTIFNLFLWTAAWVISIAIATFGPIWIWESNKIVISLSILATVAIGIQMLRANILHLRELDELQQKIHLEAMSITLGLALIFGLAFSLLDTTNMISGDAEISFLVIFMGLTYVAAVFINNWRYV
jgi:hypothetical protein